MNHEIPHAMPEDEGPNPYPTNERFYTSTELYADGWVPNSTVTESAERARQRLETTEQDLSTPGGDLTEYWAGLTDISAID